MDGAIPVQIGEDKDLTIRVRLISGEGRVHVFLDSEEILQGGRDGDWLLFPIAKSKKPFLRRARIKTAIKDIDPDTTNNRVAEEIEILESDPPFNKQNALNLPNNLGGYVFDSYLFFC